MTRFWITLQQGIEFVLSSFPYMSGGEIFVPKIPSMKVVELARCIAPNLKQKTVGIRVGEKLHEVMITKEDALSTIELDDRYIILPNNVLKYKDRNYKFKNKKGQQVKNGFEYSSDTNNNWLNKKELLKMLKEN